MKIKCDKLCVHDENTIWGVGDDSKLAIQDAAQFLDSDLGPYTVQELTAHISSDENTESNNPLKISNISNEKYLSYADSGASLFYFRDGIIISENEYDALEEIDAIRLSPVPSYGPDIDNLMSHDHDLIDLSNLAEEKKKIEFDLEVLRIELGKKESEFNRVHSLYTELSCTTNRHRIRRRAHIQLQQEQNKRHRLLIEDILFNAFENKNQNLEKRGDRIRFTKEFSESQNLETRNITLTQSISDKEIYFIDSNYWINILEIGGII